VYSQAACTIAATASENCNGGLFFDRDSGFVNPLQIFVNFDPTASFLKGKVHGFRLDGTFRVDMKNLMSAHVESAPLNSRGWVSQERQLSPRIIHFSKDQVFWECYQKTSSEVYPDLPLWAMPTWYKNPTDLKRRLHHYARSREVDTESGSAVSSQRISFSDSLFWAWCSFRIAYSTGRLSQGSDKLVAMRGIAHKVSEATGDELVAGLWRSRMIEELCWWKRMIAGDPPFSEPTQWRAPTWSWASSNARIWSSTLTKFHRKHAGRTFEAVYVGSNVKTRVSGELDHAYMDIRCKLLRASFVPKFDNQDYRFHSTQPEGYLDLIGYDIETMDVVPSRLNGIFGVSFYSDSELEPGTKLHGYLVVIQHCLHDYQKVENNESAKPSWTGKDDEAYKNPEECDCLEGLFVTHCPDQEHFERRGLVHMSIYRKASEIVVQVLRALEKAEEQLITLA
jgi:hypothetical protein